MPLTKDEMVAIKREALGGDRAAVAWNEAMDALHSYARLSLCSLGGDVIAWFEERRNAYQEAMREAIVASHEAGRTD